MLGPHTTYDEGPILDVNYFPRYVLVFCISKDSPAMLPINYVHLLPAIYYICSPCAAAILRRRFRNNWTICLNFGRILSVGAALVPPGFPWQFSFISRDRESVTVGMHWALCQLAYLMSMLSDFFFYRISWELKIQSIIVDMHWMFCRFAYFISPTHQTQKSIQSESFRQPPIAVPWKNKRLFCSFFKDLPP